MASSFPSPPHHRRRRRVGDGDEGGRGLLAFHHSTSPSSLHRLETTMLVEDLIYQYEVRVERSAAVQAAHFTPHGDPDLDRVSALAQDFAKKWLKETESLSSTEKASFLPPTATKKRDGMKKKQKKNGGKVAASQRSAATRTSPQRSASTRPPIAAEDVVGSDALRLQSQSVPPRIQKQQQHAGSSSSEIFPPIPATRHQKESAVLGSRLKGGSSLAPSPVRGTSSKSKVVLSQDRIAVQRGRHSPPTEVPPIIRPFLDALKKSTSLAERNKKPLGAPYQMTAYDRYCQEEKRKHQVSLPRVLALEEKRMKHRETVKAHLDEVGEDTASTGLPHPSVNLVTSEARPSFVQILSSTVATNRTYQGGGGVGLPPLVAPVKRGKKQKPFFVSPKKRGGEPKQPSGSRVTTADATPDHDRGLPPPTSPEATTSPSSKPLQSTPPEEAAALTPTSGVHHDDADHDMGDVEEEEGGVTTVSSITGPPAAAVLFVFSEKEAVDKISSWWQKRKGLHAFSSAAEVAYVSLQSALAERRIEFQQRYAYAKTETPAVTRVPLRGKGGGHHFGDFL